jgi:hypothetical protein
MSGSRSSKITSASRSVAWSSTKMIRIIGKTLDLVDGCGGLAIE